MTNYVHLTPEVLTCHSDGVLTNDLPSLHQHPRVQRVVGHLLPLLALDGPGVGPLRGEAGRQALGAGEVVDQAAPQYGHQKVSGS